MRTYCCEKFESRAELKREQGVNIRIIRFSKDELIDTNHLYRFFITPGYKSEERGTPHLNIAYCPFCGQNLFKFYNSDEFINENHPEFLYF